MLNQSTPILQRIKTGLLLYLKQCSEDKAMLVGLNSDKNLIEKNRLAKEIKETSDLIEPINNELNKRYKHEQLELVN